MGILWRWSFSDERGAPVGFWWGRFLKSKVPLNTPYVALEILGSYGKTTVGAYCETSSRVSLNTPTPPALPDLEV